MSGDNLPLVQRPDAYSDRFVALDPASATLVVKHYTMFKPTRTIPLRSLCYILPAKEEVIHRWGLRQHGYAHGIRWAKDNTRGNSFRGPRSGYDGNFVVKVKGTSIRCGFSIENPALFLVALEILRPGVPKTKHARDQMVHVEDDLVKEI